jgi:molybdopterin molybdotransferase
MRVEVQLTHGPIAEPAATAPECGAKPGAKVEFRGVVRDTENGEPISALEYEGYEDMAAREMRRILTEIERRHPCLGVRVVHRLGLVPVGELALLVSVDALHRAEAFALLAEFMNRLKQDVPIWKLRALPPANPSLPSDARTDLPPGFGVRRGAPLSRINNLNRTDLGSRSLGKRNSPSALQNAAAPAGTPLTPLGPRQDPSEDAPVPLASAAALQTVSQPTLTAEQILGLVRQHCVPLETETVALDFAADRVLREAVRAPEDQPPFDRSAFDGYAVRLDDPATQFTVADTIRAGEWKPRQLALGQTVQVATGAALPSHGLQVLMKEHVRVQGPRVEVLRRGPELNVQTRGQFARKGDELLSAGVRLQAGQLALLASVGYAQPRVTRRVRVAHFATGNELVPPDQAPGPGQVRDSNSILVRSFLSQWPVELQQQHLPEDEAEARLRLTQALHPRSGLGGQEKEKGEKGSTHSLVHERMENDPSYGLTLCSCAAPCADLLLVSGGASVGEHDFTERLLAQAGYTIHLRKTNLRPGKPLIFASRRASLAFGLPGNPLSHFVCLHLFVRAALAGLVGLSAEPPFASGALAVDLRASDSPRETFWPARAVLSTEGIAVTPLRWSNSGDLTCLAAANALLRVPPGTGTLPRGATIEFVPTFPLTP